MGEAIVLGPVMFSHGNNRITGHKCRHTDLMKGDFKLKGLPDVQVSKIRQGIQEVTRPRSETRWWVIQTHGTFKGSKQKAKSKHKDL